MTTQSLSYAKAKANSPSPAFFPAKSTVFARSSVSFLGYNCLPRKLQCSARQLRNFGAISASDSETSPTNNSVRWLLEPVGLSSNLFLLVLCVFVCVCVCVKLKNERWTKFRECT